MTWLVFDDSDSDPSVLTVRTKKYAAVVGWFVSRTKFVGPIFENKTKSIRVSPR